MWLIPGRDRRKEPAGHLAHFPLPILQHAASEKESNLECEFALWHVPSPLPTDDAFAS